MDGLIWSGDSSERERTEQAILTARRSVPVVPHRQLPGEYLYPLRRGEGIREAVNCLVKLGLGISTILSTPGALAAWLNSKGSPGGAGKTTLDEESAGIPGGLQRGEEGSTASWRGKKSSP